MSEVEHIVCAVRGSPQSRETVTRAIELALEHGARLTFLYVVDAEFQSQAAIGSPLRTIYQELTHLAEFSLQILTDRAQRRGVEQAQSEIRTGDIRKQLLLFATETQADLMVMGRPFPSFGRPVFAAKEFETFAAELTKVAHPTEVLLHPPLDPG